MLKDIRTGRWGLEGEVFFPLFDRYIRFSADRDAGIADVQRCALYLNALPEPVIQELCEASIRYCRSYSRTVGHATPEGLGPQAVLSMIGPRTLIVPEPGEREEAVVHLELDCDWEEEHGMEWLVRSDQVFYVGPFCSLNPWHAYDPEDAGYANVTVEPGPVSAGTLEGAMPPSVPPHGTLVLPEGLASASALLCLHHEPDIGEIWSAEMEGSPYWILKTADAVYGYQKSDAPERRVADVIEESRHRLMYVLSADIDPTRIRGLRIERGASKESVAQLVDQLDRWCNVARTRGRKPDAQHWPPGVAQGPAHRIGGDHEAEFE